MELNKIHNGDCIQYMKTLANDCVDYVITSPPYNFGKNDKYKEFSDNKTMEEYFEWTKQVIDECLRITKETVFYNIQMISGNKVALLKTLGHYAEYIKDIIIWDKITAEPAIQKNVLNSQFEFIICLNKSKTNRMFAGGAKFWGTIPNILKLNKATGNDFSSLNKATFTKDLPLFFIQNFTNEGDIIMDPFMGTGTTALAAKELKRSFLGCEISADLCEVTNRRLEQGSLF